MTDVTLALVGIGAALLVSQTPPQTPAQAFTFRGFLWLSAAAFLILSLLDTLGVISW